MALVKFITGDLASFNALATKDADALYFIEDTRQLYKGDTLYSGGSYAVVTEFPETGEINTLYINTATGAVKFYNGTAYIDVVKPIDVITEDAEGLATAKAVYDYLQGKLSDLDVGALEGRVTANEKAIETINGDETTEGSIKNAIDTLSKAIDTKLEDYAKKATTLAGYGIEDAYTKTETDTAIATAIANADHLKREIVTELPAVEDAKDNILYMVAKEGSGNDVYNEFLLINGKFEKLGDTAVDLSDYATKTYVDDADTTTLTSAKEYVESLLSWTAIESTEITE